MDPERAPSRAEAERDALMRVAGATATAAGVEDVVELAAEAAHAVIGEGGLSICEWDRAGDAMRTLFTAGGPARRTGAVPRGGVYALTEFPMVAQLLRTGEPQFLTVEDPDAPRRSVEVLKAAGMSSSVGVAIATRGEVWGAIWAAASAGAPSFRGRDVRFLETIAGQLAAVVDRAKRFSTVSRLAYEDPLTGLANRRAFEERLDRAADRHAADGCPIGLLICDVDGLKAINDARGHQAGDRALRRVAEALVAAASPYPETTVARLSGDEFAVIIEGHSSADARAIAGHALALLNAGRDVPLALSCGIASATASLSAPRALLAAADTAQYAAKRRGGGQVCIAGPNTRPEPDPPRRRVSRRSLNERVELCSAELLEALDGPYRDASTVDRLEVVTAGFAEAINAAAWTISVAEHGSPVIRSVRTADDRDGRLRGVRVALEDDQYLLADYPLTQELVGAGAGMYLIDANDRGADPAERALLVELGFSGVLGAAVSDPEAVHLVELYADGSSGDLAPASLRLQLLTRAAAARSAGTTQRMDQLGKRTHQLASTAALGTRLADLTDHGEIVEATVDVLAREFGFAACAVDRLTGDGRLELAGGRGAAIERLLDDGGWSQVAALGLTGRALRDGEVVVVDDVRREPDYRATLETAATRSEMCAPLWAGDELWGVIDLQDEREDAFDVDDVRLVGMVADQVSAALRSASLFGALEAAYLGTAEALVAALEAKDAYTASHSRSIAANAEAVGRELGLEEAQLRTLRWDGAGYPDGLSGAEIPLGARIIFACDAYDAMTTDRPYRAALGEEAAAAELAANAGTQFDPVVVEALLCVLERRGGGVPALAAS